MSESLDERTNRSMRDRILRMEVCTATMQKDVRRILTLLDSGEDNKPGFKIRLDRLEQTAKNRLNRLARLEVAVVTFVGWIVYHVLTR